MLFVWGFVLGASLTALSISGVLWGIVKSLERANDRENKMTIHMEKLEALSEARNKHIEEIAHNLISGGNCRAILGGCPT